MLKKIITTFSVIALVVSSLGLVRPAAAATVALADLESGDLIRSTSLPAVYYYGKDGFRYVFPNDKTYFTWYSDFNSVKWISDADMGKLQIGGNITYKPGVKMIKINSRNETYAVGENGDLHWVTSEAVAISLYGSSWNRNIDDVPDGFFSNYNISTDIEDASDFSPTDATASATSIDSDKNLKSPYIINITDSGYSSTTLNAKVGRAIKFVNKGTTKHSATAEDLSWGSGTLNPDESFIRYFNTVGTYEYFCSYNSALTGTIEVTE
jgi:plastocyanin